MTNASAAKPARKIKLDKERIIVLDMNAFCLLEEALEKRDGTRNLFQAINWNNLNFREFSLVVWAALMTHNPELSLEDVKSMITLQHFQELRPVIDEMLGDSMPPADPRQEGEVVEEKKSVTNP